MPPAKQAVAARSTAGVAFAAGVAVALILSWLRYPGLLALWVSCIAAASFAVSPTYTGAKGPDGQPTPAGTEEREALRFRRWKVLRRTMWPASTWLPFNVPSAQQRERLRQLPMIAQLIGWAATIASTTRMSALAAAGGSVIAATLPVDSLPVHLWWANAAAVYVVVVGFDHAVRATSYVDEVVPAVTVGSLLSAWGEGEPQRRPVLLGALAGGVAAAFGCYVALRAFQLTWLIVPAELAAAGMGVVVAATVVHSAYRPAVHATMVARAAARAEWQARWRALKLDVRLIDHVTLGDGAVEDVFEAPATLGATGAMALGPKVAPFIAAGSRVTLLPLLSGSGAQHPTQFRALTVGPDMPSPSEASTNTRLLGAWVEVTAAAAVRAAAGQGAVVPTLASLVLATTEASEVPVWEARFAGADGLELAASGIADGLATDAVPLPPDGAAPAGRVLFGMLDLEAATFAEPGMQERLERLSWELRWKRRWRDIFKTTERSIPVPQWDAKQDATLVLPSGDAVIHAAPHLTAQGDKIGLYMSPTIAENLPTTLASAPFCTVVGWPDGVVPGGRNPQAFTVLWSEKPVPKNPAEIPSNASKLAAKWALARSLNDGFDAAKLPRPEVAAAQCMTRPGGPGSIWKVSLRLFGGVTLDAVKRALPKMRVALESPSWFIVSPSDVGCDVFVGAHPKTEGLRFVSRSAQQSCTVADLEDAFTAAKLDSPFDGSSPTLLRVEQLESNDAVTRMEFQIPAQMGLAAFQEPKAVDKLRTATGNAFLEVHPGSLPSEFVVLASETDPMPSPAPFRWEEAGADYRRVPFATRVDGRSCVWDLDLDSHLLVLGQNGSGKGVAMTAIAAPMIMNYWDLYAGDPIKGFNDFAPLDPWLRARATTYEQTAALLKHFVLLIEERKDLNAAHGVSNIRDLPADARPRMAALFLDELTSLVIPEAARKPPEGADAIALREYAEACRINECKALIAAGLGRIVREGRATGAVVVAAGQKLTADLLERIPGGKTIKSQFSRLAMGKMSFGDLTSAFSDPQAAMGLLGQTVPRGRGIFESTAEAPFAVQTWWGGGSQTDHFRDIVDRVSAVRAPLADHERLDFSEAERSADESVVPVFGQRLDDDEEVLTPVAEPVVDLGNLGTLGLDFESEPEPTPIEAPPLPTPDVSPHAPAAASGGDVESLPAALVAASSSAALAAEGLDGVLVSVEGARVDVAAVAAGADVVAELTAFLRARPRSERAMVVHCRVSADWLPGVPTSVLLDDAGARAGVPVVCAEPSAAVPELVSGLHPVPADSPPAPKPIAPAPLAPGAVPMPLSAPAPLELFAPPATPQIVIDPRVRFD